jgi:DNA repair exonuclease SbcCD ATPase subunit
VRLTRIALTDFLSWSEMDLDLSGVDVLGVSGRVGSGKSSGMLDALLWCLFGEGRASADGMIRQGADRTSVTVEFEAAGSSVAVTRERVRGESSALMLEVDGRNVTRHTIAETEAAIVDLLGVTADALCATAVMVQGRSDEFVRLRPGDRMALLSDLTVPDPYPAWHEEAKKRRDAARDAVIAAEAKRRALEAQAVALSSAKADLARYAAAADRATAAAQDSAQALVLASTDAADARFRAERYRSATSRRTALESALSAVTGERDRLLSVVARHEDTLDLPEPVVPDIGPTADEWVVVERGVREATEARTKYGSLDAQLSAARAEHERLCASAVDLERVPCHGVGVYATCPLLVEAPKPETAERALALVSRLELERDRLLPVAAGYEVALEQRAAMMTREREESRILSEARQAHEAWVLRQEQATLGRTVACESLRSIEDRIAADQAELDGLPQEAEEPVVEDDLAALQQRADDDASAAQQLRTAAAVAAHTLEQAEQATRDAAGAAEEARRQTATAEMYAALADAWHPYGIPRAIVEESIPQIEAGANEALGRLPGGFSLRLATRREKRSGPGSVDTLDVVVERRGRERDYGLLSGGERFRVDLSLRLGIAGLLAQRTGRRVSSLVLDEPLSPGDSQEREAVTDAIAALSDEFPFIAVISHDAEFADQLPWELVVTKDESTDCSHAELRRR